MGIRILIITRLRTDVSNEAFFEQISADLGAGRTEGIQARVLEAAGSMDDPFEIIKCISLLKLVPQDGTESKLCGMLVDKADAGNGLEIGTALWNLGCPTFALEIVKGLEPSDRTYRLQCHCLYDVEEYESALDLYQRIKVPVINDRIMLSHIQSAVGEHTLAIKTASELLEEFPNDYDVRIAYVDALMMGGRDKEAAKYARNAVKDKSADSNAIAAYVLRIAGNIKASAGYATRAIQIDNGHIGAMESLGICLAQKGEYDKARIVAGAINEISPGDKKAVNILTYCEGN